MGGPLAAPMYNISSVAMIANLLEMVNCGKSTYVHVGMWKVLTPFLYPHIPYCNLTPALALSIEPALVV